MISRKLPGIVIESLIEDRVIRFFVHDPDEYIQKFHAAGRFYEQDSLELMAAHMTAGTRYVDVGANIGNHLIYFGRIVGLEHMLPIEPNPLAATILEFNVLLNGLSAAVDLSCLAYGLAAESGQADILIPRENLGAARLTGCPDGRVAIRRGDELLAGQAVDFIKIDTEGMEIACLAGLESTIRRCLPIIFIEVDDANSAEFEGWCSAHRYRIEARQRHYSNNENFLLRHESH